MAIISTTTNHQDDAMAAIFGQDEDEAGADLLLPEKQRVHPISTKVAQLLLDLLVLAATWPASFSFAFSRRAVLHPSPTPSLNSFTAASKEGFLDNEVVDDEESFAVCVRPWRLLRRCGSASFQADNCLVPGSRPHESCLGLFVAVDVGGWAASACLPAQLVGDADAVLCGGGGGSCCWVDSVDAVTIQAKPPCSIKRGPPSEPRGPLHQCGGYVTKFNKEPITSLMSISRGPRQGLSMKLRLVVGKYRPSNLFLFTCRGMQTLQPLVLLFSVSIGQLLLRGWFGDSASPGFSVRASSTFGDDINNILRLSEYYFFNSSSGPLLTVASRGQSIWVHASLTPLRIPLAGRIVFPYASVDAAVSFSDLRTLM